MSSVKFQSRHHPFEDLLEPSVKFQSRHHPFEVFWRTPTCFGRRATEKMLESSPHQHPRAPLCTAFSYIEPPLRFCVPVLLTRNSGSIKVILAVGLELKQYGNKILRCAETRSSSRQATRNILAIKHRQQYINCGNTTLTLIIRSRCSNVGSHDDICMLEKSISVGLKCWRLNFHSIESRTKYSFLIESFKQRLFINVATSCSVEQDSTWLHHLELFLSDHSSRSAAQRHMKTDHIRLPQ